MSGSLVRFMKQYRTVHKENETGEDDVYHIPTEASPSFYTTKPLTITAGYIPDDQLLINRLGNLRFKEGSKPIKNSPKTFALALVLAGYINRFSDDGVIHMSVDIEKAWGVSKSTLNKAVKCLEAVCVRSFSKSIECNGKTVVIGKQYIAGGLLKSCGVRDCSGGVVIEVDDSDEVEVIPVASVTRRELIAKPKSIRVEKDSILDKLKADGVITEFEYTVKCTIEGLDKSIIDALKEVQLVTNKTDSKTPNRLSHGHNKATLHNILLTIKYLLDSNPDTPTFEDPILAELGEDSCEIIYNDYYSMGYDDLTKHLFGGGATNRGNAIVNILNVLEGVTPTKYVEKHGEDHLTKVKWIEAKQSSSGGRKAYLNGNEVAEYRFTRDFISLVNGGGTKEDVEVELKRVAPFEVLRDITLAPSVFGVFNDVATNRGWDERTRSIQYNKLTNFDLNKHKFSEPREGSRVYTAISELPSEFRKHLLIDGEATGEIDMKTAHPYLLAYYFTDAKQRREWLDFLDRNDLYDYLVEHCKLEDECVAGFRPEELRSIYKQLFNAYLNGAQEGGFEDIARGASQFGHQCERLFPSVHNTKELLIACDSDDSYHQQTEHDRTQPPKGNNGSSLKLQELESKVMGSYFMAYSDYKCVSIHDGILGKVKELQEMRVKAEEKIKEVIEYKIKVEIKE